MGLRYDMKNDPPKMEVQCKGCKNWIIYNSNCKCCGSHKTINLIKLKS